MKGKQDLYLIGAVVLVVLSLASLVYGLATDKNVFIAIPALGVGGILGYLFISGWLFERRVQQKMKWWRQVGEEYEAKWRARH